MPWLAAREKPTFSELQIKSTCGNCARMASGVPSLEALSTTTTSISRCVFSISEARQASDFSLPSSVMMQTLNSFMIDLP